MSIIPGRTCVLRDASSRRPSMMHGRIALFAKIGFVASLLLATTLSIGSCSGGGDDGPTAPTYQGGNVSADNPCARCQQFTFTSGSKTAVWTANATGPRGMGYLDGGVNPYRIEAKYCVGNDGNSWGWVESGSFLVDGDTHVTFKCDGNGRAFGFDVSNAGK